MTRIILVSVLLAACGDNTGPAESTGERVLAMCGDAPVYPVLDAVVTFDASTVTVYRGYLNKQTQYAADIAVWLDCVKTLP